MKRPVFDVKRMRAIDHHVGNVVCRGLALAKSVTAPLRRQPERYRKILVMKFFGMGSIVVASPSLVALREQFPDAEIHFVSFKQNRALLEMLGLTEKQFYVDNSSPRAFAQSVARVARDLAREDYDLAIDLEFFAKFPLVLASLAGIPLKAGFYLTQEPWRRTMLDVHGNYNHYFHTKDIFLSLVYLLSTGDFYYTAFEKFRQRYRYPRLEPAASDVERVDAVLAGHGVRSAQKLFVINANTSPDLAPQVRKWPEERYGELARRILAEHPDAAVAFIGAPDESAYVAEVVATAGDARVFSVAGEVTLRELLALFSRATAFVSNDSGPMHLACLADTPTVGLFFADTPVLFAPLGSNVASVSPDLYSIPLYTVYNGKDVVVGRPAESIENVAARAVSIEEVMSAVRGVMNRTAIGHGLHLAADEEDEREAAS
jgi:ADP-heptose:LPS heptosyltransferase